MVCSAWFRERLRKASLKKENDMVQDIDIKSKRILLFDFDGTLIETASGNTFATDLTDMRIKMDVVNKALDLMQENGVKVCAEKAGVEYMDVITFVGKDLDLNYVLSKEHTSEGIVILNNDHIYILENPYGVDLNIKITLKDFYKIETDDGKNATVDDVLNIRIDKDQSFNSYSDIIKIETLEDGSIKYISLYHESKENSDSLS